MDTEESIQIYSSTRCTRSTRRKEASTLPPLPISENIQNQDSIDDQIIADFNKKTFDTSSEISFEGFITPSDDDSDKSVKINFWGAASYIKIMDRLMTLEESLAKEKNNNFILKEHVEKLEAKQNKNYYYLNNDIDKLYDDLNSVDYKIIHLDQYTRRESLVISGINANIKQENLEYTVLKILRTIGLNTISSYEITACHRLQNKNDRYPPRTIVRFTNRKIVEHCLRNRDLLLYKKKELNMNLRFYEHLTDNNELVLKECSILLKYGIIKSYFIRNGFVKIVVAEGDRPFKVIHPHILYDKFKDFFDHDELEYMP